jgi:hypothetical protein
MDSVLASRFHASLCQSGDHRDPQTHRMPLGLLLLERGLIQRSDLRRALSEQKKSGGYIGKLLQSFGVVDELTVTSMVAAQWCCPVFPVSSVFLGCATLVPLYLLDLYRMLPVHYSAVSRKLFVAFEYAVDANALYALESMLSCDTEPCFLPSSSITAFRERLREKTTQREIVIEQPTEVDEMAQVTRRYLLQWKARQIQHTVCGEHVWVRLESASSKMNLLFRRPSGQ